jgi:predicted transcriptional regulator
MSAKVMACTTWAWVKFEDGAVKRVHAWVVDGPVCVPMVEFDGELVRADDHLGRYDLHDNKPQDDRVILDRRARIVDCLRANPGSTAHEVITQVGGNRAAMHGLLTQLVQTGVVVKDVEGRAHRYRLAVTP